VNESKPLIAGLGEVLWDLLPDGSQLGGAPANFAAHAAALGAKAILISAVGNDSMGEKAIEMLGRLNIDHTNVARCDHPTGTVQIEVVDGEPTYEITKNVAWDHCVWHEGLAEVAESLDAVCFGTLFQRSITSHETTRRFLQATCSECLRIFDVNLRQDFFSDEVITESLEHANVLKLNHRELAVVSKVVGIEADKQSFIQEICKRFELKLATLTCGADGSWMGNTDTVHFCPSIPAEVVDTVGAGDSFTAAMVVGTLKQKPIPQVHADASRLAVSVCSHSGAIKI